MLLFRSYWSPACYGLVLSSEFGLCCSRAARVSAGSSSIWLCLCAATRVPLTVLSRLYKLLVSTCALCPLPAAFSAVSYAYLALRVLVAGSCVAFWVARSLLRRRPSTSSGGFAGRADHDASAFTLIRGTT